MSGKLPERLHYTEILEHLKTSFPYPISNPIMDGYFVHTMSRFLDRVDDLKSEVPILGIGLRGHYQQVQGVGFPEDIGSVEEITGELVSWARATGHCACMRA